MDKQGKRAERIDIDWTNFVGAIIDDRKDSLKKGADNYNLEFERGVRVGEYQRKQRDVKTSDFKKGDKVTYVPVHAQGDRNHPDCEDGVVSSVNEKTVFVKYNNAACKMETGDEPYTAAATYPKDLVKRRCDRTFGFVCDCGSTKHP